MKNILRLLLAASAAFCATDGAAQTDDMRRSFEEPPQEARPYVWWHWMNGNISKQGIYKDLTWMHQSGIAGFHVFDAGLNTPQIVPSRIKYMTPEWKDCFAYALHLADSLGMSVAIPSSPGWSNTGGPWVKPTDAMKKITWRTVRIDGGKKIDMQLPDIYTTTGNFQNVPHSTTETFSEPIGTVAVRMPESDRTLAELHPTVQTSKGQVDMELLTDGDYSKAARLEPDENGKIWVQYTFGKPTTIKALSLSDGTIRNNWNSWSAPLYFRLETSDDGINFSHVCDVPQSGCSQQTIALPPTSARCFRVTSLQPQRNADGKTWVDMFEYNLFTTGRINFAEEKAGFTAFGDLDQYPTPDYTYVPQQGDVVVLNDKVNASGRLVWSAPEGKWIIYRFGTSLYGTKNHPASPEATGLEVDKMDARAVHDYIEHYLDLYEDAAGGQMVKKGLHGLLIDSYEAGNATWTLDMPAQFEKRRGYSLYPWLPVLTGAIVESSARSEQFLYDYRHTIGELLQEGVYAQLVAAAHRRGMKMYVESHENGRQLLADGISAKALGDIPMGAMWAQKDADFSMYECDLRETASTAHIYGKRYVAGESFTASGVNEVCYTFYPGNLKPIADYMMSCGLNRFIIHESAHQPDDEHKPGMALAIYGQWFNRHETWAGLAKVWTDYLGRSSYMMQQGDYVADIAYYYGSDNSVTGRFGHAHPTIPPSYSFDYVNPEALIKVFGYDGTHLTTYAGMKYSLLVIDKNVKGMTVEELEALASLAKGGAPICGKRPVKQPELNADTAHWQQLVSEIWDAQLPNVMENLDMSQALDSIKVKPDIIYNTTESVRWIHRRKDDVDIYWVCNATGQTKLMEFSFNVTGKKPQIWNAVDAQMSEVDYIMENGRTHVKVNMNPYDAYFVVFGQKTDTTSLTLPHHERQCVMTLDTHWDVTFGGVQDTPEKIHMDTLQSFTENDDRQIRYFSGTAVYDKDFTLPHYDRKCAYTLNLGGVGCMAEVWLNGHRLGVLWKAPYTIDITSALKKKGNHLQVKVTNLWANRIIGDKQPDAKQYAWTSYNGAFNASSKLLPSGLLSGVQILKQSE